MKFLCRNSHFAPQTEFSSIRKSGRCINIDSRAVHMRSKVSSRSCVRCDDRLTVTGGVNRNMGNCFLHGIHHLNCKNVIQKLGIKIIGTRLFAVNDEFQKLFFVHGH